MRFRNWFESEEESGGPWGKEHPWLKRLGKVDYNKSQVNVFVNAMADNHKNAAALWYIMNNRGSSYSNERYNKPIANNLLIHNDLRLKNAVGKVENSFGEFKFETSGENAGSIFIQHPPVVYDETDKLGMFGVIVHELAHADHWTKDKRFKPAPAYSFDDEKYQRHWTECRAYSQQLIALLHNTPDKQDILKVFDRPIKTDFFDVQGQQRAYSKSSPFSWGAFPGLLEFAKIFLAHYQGKNEGVLANILAPLVTAASMLMNPQPGLPAHSQPVMQQQVSRKNEAADLVKQIVQKMLLRNFLIRV